MQLILRPETCGINSVSSTNNLHNSVLYSEVCKRYALFVPTVVVNKVAIGLILDLCPDTLFTQINQIMTQALITLTTTTVTKGENIMLSVYEN